MHVQIRLLGEFAVTIDGESVPRDAWRRDRAAALVKLLAVTPAHRVHREQAMELFWPDADPEAAGASLRKAVHFARRVIGRHEFIETTGDMIAFAGDAELVIDTEQFEACASDALRRAEAPAYEAAAALYTGDLLPDDRYVDWLDAPRAALLQRYIAVLRAGQLWQQLIAADPTDEPAQCALMQAALAAGNRAEAIRLFNQLRHSLNLEIGIGPSAEAVRLYEAALAIPSVDPVSQTDRIRASLAWGLLHLQSGDFDKAAEVARETRRLAMAAGLVREVGEASALVGLAAHMRGRWRELFRAEFIESVRATPDSTVQVFDGHLCLAEFCLCNAKGHHEIGVAAQELLAVAEGAGSLPGRGLASLVLGEVALFSGHIDEAQRLLTEAESLLAAANAASGRVLALERLAEIALSRGRIWQANRLIRRAHALKDRSWIAPHLEIRLASLSVRMATTRDQLLDIVEAGDRLLAAPGGACQPCSMGYRIASATALATHRELAQVNRRLDEAERIAGMWLGGPWVASVWEARGVQRRAEHNETRAQAAFEEAAARFAALGRPADEARCLGQMTLQEA